MKKMILTTAAFALVVVSSIALAPTKAEALPAFARQTGAACLSCHFQTFPALNAFGRAFMYGSFTDVGDQALIEDDDLSIPAVLNASFDIRGNYTNESSTGQASTGTYGLPQDARLFLAGRIGSNSGAFVMFTGGSNKMGMGPRNGANMNMGPAPVWMFLNSWDVGDFKVGLSAQKSPWGGSNVMEVSNVFGHRGDKLGGQDISAIKGAGFTKMSTSIGTWVGNDLGYVQFSLVAPATQTTGFTNVGLSFGKLIRVVATLDVGGFDTLIGFGSVTGSAGKGTTTTVAGGGLTSDRVPMNIQFVDAQMQGDIGDMSLGIYADWAHAKGKTSTVGVTSGENFYGSELGANLSGSKFDAFSIRADLEPINRFLVGIGYGYQRLSQGAATVARLGGNTGDITKKVFHLAATYKVYQNLDLNLTYDNAKFNDPSGTLGTLTAFTTRTTVLSFEALM